MRPSLLALLLVSAPSLTAAQTVIVNYSSADVADFGGAQTVSDLPGPDGRVTLREAVLAANNTAGPQTIAFAIPRSDWSPLDNSQALIQLESLVYLSGDDTVVDFTTQTAFTGDTNPNGGEIGLQYVGPPAGIPSLWLAGQRCTVRGLDRTIGNNFGNGLWISGSHNLVVGCTTNGLLIRGDYAGGGDFNQIGGTQPGEGNRFSEGFDILSGASDNLVVGNSIRWGLRISGDTLYGTCDRNRVTGNVLAGHGYYGEEGFPLGTQLEIYHAANTVVEDNLVGTLDGVNPFPGRSGTGGVAVGIGARDTLVRSNVISGIDMLGTNHYAGQRFGTAIGVEASALRTTILDNRIGVAADGVAPLGNVQGILVQSNPNGIPHGVVIGGVAAGEANVIANNRTTGIKVVNSADGVAMRGNSIHDNGALGIDLVDGFGPGGVTPNDPLDADTFGGNHLQNFPVIQRALRSGRNTLLIGRLDSEPAQAFAIDFYGSSALDATGFGEASAYLGSATITTDAAGHASFATAVPNVPAGWFVTATATQLARGETSELSAGRRQRMALLMP